MATAAAGRVPALGAPRGAAPESRVGSPPGWERAGGSVERESAPPEGPRPEPAPPDRSEPRESAPVPEPRVAVGGPAGSAAWAPPSAAAQRGSPSGRTPRPAPAP